MSGPRSYRGRWRTIGAAALVTLVALSWAAAAIATMLLELTTAQKVMALGAAALVTEAALYVGAAFLGVALFQRVRARFRLRGLGRK